MRDRPGPTGDELTGLRDRNAELEAEVGRLRQRQAELEAEVGGLMQRQAELEAEVGRLGQRQAATVSRPGLADVSDGAIVAAVGEDMAATIREAYSAAAETRRRASIDAQEMLASARAAVATGADPVLAELREHRRVVAVQIQQLLVGRERLLEAYETVRQHLALAHDQLDRADGEARDAAYRAGEAARAALGGGGGDGAGRAVDTSDAVRVGPDRSAPTG